MSILRKFAVLTIFLKLDSCVIWAFNDYAAYYLLPVPWEDVESNFLFIFEKSIHYILKGLLK